MYGDPVYGEDFFDRDEILSLLQRRMASFRQGDKRNLALIGLRKTGKTSILLEFKRRLTDADVLPIFVYIKPEEITTFAHRFMGALLYEFLKRRGEKPDEDFEQLLSLGIEHAPRTASAILHLRQTMETMPKESIFASKMMLYFLMFRYISERQDRIATKLYNVYCFGYPLGVDSKEMLWPEDFPEGTSNE